MQADVGAQARAPQAPCRSHAARSAARKRNAPSSLSTTSEPHDVNTKRDSTRHSARTHVSPASRTAVAPLLAPPPPPPPATTTAASRSRAPSSIGDSSFAPPTSPPPPGSVSVGSVKRRATQASRPSSRRPRKLQTRARASSGNSSLPSGSGASAGGASSSSATAGVGAAAVCSATGGSRTARPCAAGGGTPSSWLGRPEQQRSRRTCSRLAWCVLGCNYYSAVSAGTLGRTEG
eukprot:COSAG06_NODE_5207_length_3639_cov_20.382486_2_plen_234_part_00